MGGVSFFLVFLAIVLIGATALIGTDLGPGVLRRKRARAPFAGDGFSDGFDEPVASLPPVLLPDDASPADVDHVRFALGLRGYRMDQVDQVLDDLRDQLAARNAEIESLRGQLRTSARLTAAEPFTAAEPAAEQPAAQQPAAQLPESEQPAAEDRTAAKDLT
jgi:DivIVA domain-containing protein